MTRYFVVYWHERHEMRAREDYHADLVELNGPLTHAELQCAVQRAWRDRINNIGHYDIIITGYSELTRDEYADFMADDKDLPPPPSRDECVIL